MLRPSILVALVAAATVRHVISGSVPVRVVGQEYYPIAYDAFPQSTQIYLPESFGKPPQDRDVKQYYYGPVAPGKYVTQTASPPPTVYEIDVPPTTLVAPTETSWNPNNNPKLYYHPVPIPKVETKSPPLDYLKKLNEVLKKQGKSLPPALKENASIKPEFPIDKLTIKKLEKIQKQRGKTAKLDKPVILIPKKKFSAEAQGAESQRAPRPTKENLETSGDSAKSGSHFSSGEQYSPFADSHAASAHGAPSNGKGERLIFHMAGHDGPMSYKWGYDTGKGHNRQFRFEERDKEGIIKGQFGYYDKEGKFRMMNYHAHPESGFHMEPIEHGLDED
ncbi:uncharacterized protein LOC132696431 [Cylas formicarius]|uniref:uncharacterized protein LOC132696431 n=1 Tax=Cylas formicarius TaxID=197179 RepID=UPI002958CF48|nr:uncharacterized protein LOC132696431 [Cylas formicarius]